MRLYPQQQEALTQIQAFLNKENVSVFILKGYAGTGKTTLIQVLLPLLRQMKKQVLLLAPTGRAANILYEKTAYPATTIHRAIYEYRTTEVSTHDTQNTPSPSSPCTKPNDEHSDGVIRLHFTLRVPDVLPEDTIFVVDEASLVSAHKNSNEMLHFGTDVLLDDLLSFARPQQGGKLIFVGDPAQLPPVGDNRSAALDEEYFGEKGLQTMSYVLTEVLRQSNTSAILRNATTVRKLMSCNRRNELSFERVPNEVEDIKQEEVIPHFLSKQTQPTMGDRIVICYTNSRVHDYNTAIRQGYFPDRTAPQVGDIVQVVQSNYLYELLNGDFAQIVEVEDREEIAPIGSCRLQFRNVTLSIGNKIKKCKIIENLLNSPQASLSRDEMRALLVYFKIRYPQKKQEMEDMDLIMKHDPYINALQLKYGYATTCHKAQGGEWDTVYVDFYGRTRLDDDSLRWQYTAITRAIRHLYGVLMPAVTSFDKIRFNPIQKTTHPVVSAFPLVHVGEVSILPPNATNAQKAKALSVQQELELKGMAIERITLLQYRDRYTIDTGKELLDYDCTYNAAGIYTHYKPLRASEYDTIVLPALASECAYQYEMHYTPTTPPLCTLYYHLCLLCNEIGITIINVEERSQQYHVVYYFRTSDVFSSITFFFDSKGSITYGAPLSSRGADDEKLQTLIKRMQ